MELRQFFAVIWKRLWLILLATVMVTGTTYYLSAISTPIYQATTTLEIDQGADPRSDPYSALRTGEMVAKTYVEQIQSPVLLREVQSQLGIGTSVAGMVSAEQVRDTQLIRVSAESSDPALAQALADTTAQLFIERKTGQQQARFQAELANLESQIAAVETSIEETQKGIASLGDPMDPENTSMPAFVRLELARLESHLTSDQTRLVILLKSGEDFRLAMARYTDNVTIFSPAGLPTSPVRPRTLLNTVLGAISGMVLGISMAFLLEYLDDTIRSPDDIKSALPVGVLGALPHLKGLNSQTSLVVADQPRQPASEAFRNLRTSLQFSSLDQPARTLLVTSPQATDGKTFIAANLAAVIAHGGQSVILVDADLRRPRQHSLFGMPKEPGLTTALLAPEERSAVLQETAVKGLRIITSGRHAPNPAELLASQRMRAFLSWLLEQADVVVFDSPPVLSVTDAAVLSNLADGTILVVNCGETRIPAAAQAVERLTSVKKNVLGVVLNRLAPSAGAYYYYYYYYSEDGRAGRDGKLSRRIAGLVKPRRRKRTTRRREHSGGD